MTQRPIHTFHNKMSNVSSAESRVFYASVDSTVSPLRRQQCQVIVTGAQPESLCMTVDQFAVNNELCDRLVSCQLVPPVNRV